MRRRTLLLAAAVLTFLSGASLDYYLRKPEPRPDCFCASAKCSLVAVADRPLFFLSQPLETLDLRGAAHWDFRARAAA